MRRTVAWPFRSVLLLLLATGCSPVLVIAPSENLTEGQTKRLVADVKKTPCTKSIAPFFRPSGNPPGAWIASSSPTINGSTYTSDVPRSDSFIAGDTYEFKWVLSYTLYYPPPIKWFIGPCGKA